MIFKSITITEGTKKRKIDFSDKVNLVHSGKNSKGKTTLLRLLLYSIGYAIPSTKNIKFEECITETVVECLSGSLIIERRDTYLIVKNGLDQQYFILPEEASNFHTILYGTENNEILSNILGAFYIDQEKGWTLLNRGSVIGKNHFNIQQLILGLSNRDYSELQSNLDRTERELKKYKEMFSLAQYQKEINELKENTVFEDYDEAIRVEIDVLGFDCKALSDELTRVNKVINDNNSFRKYIEKMGIRVKSLNDDEIPVNKDTIIGFADNVEILLAKRRMIANQLSTLQQKISKLNMGLYKQGQQKKVETLIQTFDQNISQLQIDSKLVSRIILGLEVHQATTRKALTELTKKDNPIVTQMHSTIVKYVSELHLDDYINPSKEYLFTSNLKELSGALLHKIVFSFKLAYIDAIQSVLNITLPIILDSPSGKEVDQSNVDDMMTILNRDYKDNQIIIASIHQYPFDSINNIELFNRLID